jgi:hypothetical protein
MNLKTRIGSRSVGKVLKRIKGTVIILLLLWALLNFGGFFLQKNSKANPSLAGTQSLQPGQWKAQNPQDWGVNALSGISLEWEYFMIHDSQKNFTGSIGYVLADVKNWLGGRFGMPRLLPSGGSVAVAGLFENGEMVSHYSHFDFDALETSQAPHADLKSLKGKTKDGTQWAQFDLGNNPDTLGNRDQNPYNQARLKGDNHQVSWDLTVEPSWNWITDPQTPFSEKSDPTAFTSLKGEDVGMLPGENWEVDMLWPRTKIKGTLTQKSTQTTFPIQGHGYRENSWGQWALITDGWDFGVMSDDSAGVMVAWQSYHNSKTLDYLDLAIADETTPQKYRFFASNHSLAWRHPQWEYVPKAKQCAPLSTLIKAENETVKLEVSLEIKDRFLPMLSNTTFVTQMFVIFVQFPLFSGTVKNKATGEVKSFQGQGGGEFGVRKSLYKQDSSDCQSFLTQFAQSPAL